MPDSDLGPLLSATPLDFELASGRLHAEGRGPAGETLVLAIPGLSANLRGFDFLAERLPRAAGSLPSTSADGGISRARRFATRCRKSPESGSSKRSTRNTPTSCRSS
jgi:hypothetical protein